MSRRIVPGPGPHRVNLIAWLLLAGLAIGLAFVVASRPSVPHSRTVPTPTPYSCAGGGR